MMRAPILGISIAIRRVIMKEPKHQVVRRRWQASGLFATGLALAVVGSSVWAAGKDSIAARLQVLEDQAAVEKLITSSYSKALDTRDWKAFAALFMADGELKLLATQFPQREYKGRADIEKAFSAPLSGVPAGEGPPGGAPASMKHVITNPQVQFDGDRATATSYWMEVAIGKGKDEKPFVMSTGYYRDVLRRDNGQWKFQSREVFNHDIPVVAGSGPTASPTAPAAR
jgi:hypothetical protein